MKNKVIVFTLILLTSGLFAEILSYDKVIKNLRGIKNYNDGNFSEADKKFQDNSIAYPDDATLQYNLGNTRYKTGNLEQAENSYKLALKDRNFKNRSKAFQNLGNVKFQSKDYQNAIKHYRNALIEDPHNQEARYNYELAARYLQRQKKQNNQKDQNDKQDQKKQNKNKQQKKDQDQNKEKQKQDQPKKDQQKQKEQKKSKAKQAKEKKKKDAEKILKALLQKEKEEMKKEKEKMNVDKTKTGKYW